MTSARSLIDRLHEGAEQGDCALFFIPKLISEDGFFLPIVDETDVFTVFTQELIALYPQVDSAKSLLQDIDTSVDILINRFHLTAVLKVGGEISVYTARRKNKFSDRITNRLDQMMGVTRYDDVGWFSSLNAGPVTLPAEVVFFGEKAPPEMPKSTKSKIKPR